jgi:hypothetical protein
LKDFQLLQSQLETSQAVNQAQQSKIETLHLQVKYDALQLKFEKEGLEKEVRCVVYFLSVIFSF